MPVINFIDLNRKVICVPGANLRAEALKERYQIYKGAYLFLNCRGNGLCGSCRVAVVEGRSMPRNEVEQKKLNHVPDPWRLACQFEVLDDVTVTTDETRVAAFQQAQADAETAAKAAREAAAAPSPQADEAKPEPDNAEPSQSASAT